MSWASIASKKTETPVKNIVKSKPKPVIVEKQDFELQPIDIFDHYYGDKIFEEISRFAIKESGNNNLLRTNVSSGADLYHFFIDYVDIDYYAESKMTKDDDEHGGTSDDDFDYY